MGWIWGFLPEPVPLATAAFLVRSTAVFGTPVRRRAGLKIMGLDIFCPIWAHRFLATSTSIWPFHRLFRIDVKYPKISDPAMLTLFAMFLVKVAATPAP